MYMCLCNIEKSRFMTKLLPYHIKIHHYNKYNDVERKFRIYTYGNLVFSYNDIFDSQIPQITKHENKIKIALYHGIINGCKNADGFALTNGKFKIDDFFGCDFGLFGDIHMYQKLDKNG